MVEPTQHQREYIDELKSLSNRLSIIILKGESYSGKDFIVRQTFKELNVTPIEFNFCKLAENLPHRINSQDLIHYLDKLRDRALSLENSQPIVDSLGDNTDTQTKRYIYIRRIDKILDVVADYQSENRFLAYLLLREWVQKLEPSIRVIMTSIINTRIDTPYCWKMQIENNQSDLETILRKENISKECAVEVLKISKTQSIGQLLHCLRYVKTKCNFSDRDNFIKLYKIIFSELTGTNVNAQKEVIKPEKDLNLIGMESILEEIRINILNPIQLGHPDIPIKRGIVLCGPPGTGKTSIGRWLAYKLKGKLYLIGGEDGVSGQNLVDAFSKSVTLASKNAPAVVFIDDVDVLFTHDDTYRAFLTILDGLSNKMRENVCVIATVMNSRNIPASLMRGNRLEMCITVSLPTEATIITILKNGWEKIQKVLNELNLATDYLIFNSELCRSLAIKMTGWNCADVNRSVNDVLRTIAAGCKDPLEKVFDKSIRQIREQYEKCGPSDSVVDLDKLAYII
jgi:hypothetical protein